MKYCLGALLALIALLSGCQEATTGCYTVCNVELVLTDENGQPFCSGGPCIANGVHPPCTDITTLWAIPKFQMKIRWGDITLFDGEVNGVNDYGVSSLRLSHCMERNDIDNGALDGLSINTQTNFFVRNSPLCSNGGSSAECQCLLYSLTLQETRVKAKWDAPHCKIQIVLRSFPKAINGSFQCKPCASI